MTDLVFRDVEVTGNPTDVLVRDGRVAAIGSRVAAPASAEVIDGEGGSLIVGLWDHHIHLLALAAALDSVPVGPPGVTDAATFASALSEAAAGAPPGTWIRAVGHHESVGGDVDRDDLDRLVPIHPVRVQHRSGAKWTLNSRGLDLVGAAHAAHEGIERDRTGRPTGRLFGLDTWLRERLPRSSPPDLAPVGRLLAAHGITGVTDATPYGDPSELELLASGITSLAVPQRVMATGGAALAAAGFPGALQRGPVKLVLADHQLPGLDEVVAAIGRARDAGRTVAVHCVTRSALVLALAAWDVAGVSPGDRIEHGAVIPPELFDPIGRAGLTVVTQPNFVAERGDAYLTDVEPDDRPHLYRCASLLRAGIAVGGSTDAPFGDPDPWAAIHAAIRRQTSSGQAIGSDEAVTPRRALDLFTTSPEAPGGSPRRVLVGAAADLCLLDRPLTDALGSPSPNLVRATIIEGAIVYESGT